MQARTTRALLVVVTLALVAMVVLQLYELGLVDPKEAITIFVAEFPIGLIIYLLGVRKVGATDKAQPLTAEAGGQPAVSPTPKLTRPVSQATRTVSIADVDDVVSWGWNGPRLLDELIRIDYETIDGLTADHEGHRNQWAPVFMDHPDTWRLLVEAPREIVGYWHFVPLFEKEYQLAKQGELMDGQITTDKVRVFELPGSYNVYFVSVCVIARLRHTASVRMLFESLYEVVTEMARNGMFVNEVCANAYTPSGIAVCKSFGMKYLRDHMDHGQIWARKIFPFKSDDPLLHYTELVQLYTEKFGKASRTAQSSRSA